MKKLIKLALLPLALIAGLALFTPSTAQAADWGRRHGHHGHHGHSQHHYDYHHDHHDYHHGHFHGGRQFRTYQRPYVVYGYTPRYYSPGFRIGFSYGF